MNTWVPTMREAWDFMLWTRCQHVDRSPTSLEPKMAQIFSVYRDQKWNSILFSVQELKPVTVTGFVPVEQWKKFQAKIIRITTTEKQQPQEFTLVMLLSINSLFVCLFFRVGNWEFDLCAFINQKFCSELEKHLDAWLIEASTPLGAGWGVQRESCWEKQLELWGVI